MPDTKLILVYNADSGFFNALSSSVHKALSPETYECQLCRITYGMTRMEDEWKSYLDQLPVALEALHRNELSAKYPSLAAEPLPAIFISDAGKLDVLLNAASINDSADITTLIERVDLALTTAGLKD
ncbi:MULTISPECIES: hypothetical protein [unclassified Lentimonas]|uniref:hypothetical protein n=1 Tax=unclassified Lentimonas TaxID=2630993 RepID=UPI001327CD5E|nr:MULTISPECIES: hypothetical protein [unclassified Lentimonas]CAA6678372.1 Unannotated [Lentimonas sp. CC4]CAA6685464.1 Unannotated [Lentimonas sp. CC6]CAA6690551.1 Unannotated [Lentimonas sp. CC10]CAA6695369.1 Unannotated [Lentimonas sp. CC19]CAA7068808.1 Unannotated [Lentimonas sp. CC11]